MLESFYNYIIEELIIGFFKNQQIAKGSRYYFIIENEEYRNKFMATLKSIAKPITISNIYQSTNQKITEEPYDTYELVLPNGLPHIIIGDDITATEDYLTTIRNTVGSKNSKYENYGVLYILSNSILSSIITACQDLQGNNGPLNPSYIIDNIQHKADDIITKEFELSYLKKHLEKIAEYIADGTCDLFDFKYDLNVLAQKTLKGNFPNLEFFSDKSIYDNSFNLPPKEMQSRIDDNHKYFHEINHILCEEDDDTDRFSLLQKILDERLSKKLLNNDNWKNEIDYEDIEKSIERKNNTAHLELKDISLIDAKQKPQTKLITNYKGKWNKKSTNYILICDESIDPYQQIKLEFNKNIKKSISNNQNCQTNGQYVTINVQDSLIKQVVGVNDNHHDFYILRIPCNASFFDNVLNNFSINKKGEIVINVPDDVDDIYFGNGNQDIELPLSREIDWNSNYRLNIPINDENENNPYTIKFNNIPITIILKYNASKPNPPIGPNEIDHTKTYIGIPGNNDLFEKIKIIDSDDERAVRKFWRKYLEWEQLFIEKELHTIIYSYNDLIHENEPQFDTLDLPSNIINSLNNIYNYFQSHNTIPSLTKIDDELEQLYITYINAVQTSINSIPTTRSLSKQEYNITKLGIVSLSGKIYLSPFHPMIVAYSLEYKRQYDNLDNNSFTNKLLSPFYLIPYLFHHDVAMRPFTDSELDEVYNWLCFEKADSKPQERANDITTKMVQSKMKSFIKNFNYLFQDKDCPIIISSIGILDDTNVIKGIIEFIKQEYSKGVQKIELHEYVNNIMDETFFEKLNRLDSIDAITRELESINISIDTKGEYTNQEIIHQLFTRVSFYKHELNEHHSEEINYCHIAFYQMNDYAEYTTPPSDESRVELALNGLISIPSTLNKNDSYIIGFGTNGISNPNGYIYPMAIAMNNLYANEKNDGSSQFHNHTCVSKRYKFQSLNLLNSIYENANWVTFINPEVDIDFFYKQKDLYVIHYTDQYTINAKYDSITVTKHIRQYENMLKKSYEKNALSPDRFEDFNKTMMNYFNCLNGSWMLNIVNKSEPQIREKMSIVAAIIAMLRFMERNPNIIWIPLSLEEILRVTGSIGLPLASIFSKKEFNIKGSMSDDLLMIGLDSSDAQNLKLYYYPIEVKYSKNNSFTDKGSEQVCNTFKLFKEHIFGTSNFTKNIYRTFFASQFLTNAEKLNANNLLSSSKYSEIEKYRFQLLNLKYTIKETLPIKEMGNAALVSFYSQASHNIETSIINNVAVCKIHFSEQECLQFVSEPNNEHLSFLTTDPILIDSDTLNFINNPPINTLPNTTPNIDITIDDINDADDDNEKNNTNTITIPTPNQTDSTIQVIPQQTNSIESIKILVGKDKSLKSDVYFEPNNTKLVSHPNMGIIGTMGTGKTQFARSLIAQFAKETNHNLGGHPIGMLVFDYKGDYLDDKFLNAVNGKSYKFNYPFNPLKLIITDDTAGMNLPAITADRISDSFAKAYGLGLKQQSNIKQVIIDTYADANITKDPSTWNLPTPTMDDVIEKYFATYDANDKAFALFDKLRDYTIFTNDNNNCVSLFEWLNCVRVIDLTLYPDDTKKVIVSLILDLFYAEMRQLGGSKQENGLRELRAMIMVDEAHQFLKKDFQSLRNIISEGRMFGVGMILSTQNISDFKTSKEDYSLFILSWVIHHVNSISKPEISSIFGANDPHCNTYMQVINDAQIFESICKIGNKIKAIRDVPFFELIEQDPRFKQE